MKMVKHTKMDITLPANLVEARNTLTELTLTHPENSTLEFDEDNSSYSLVYKLQETVDDIEYFKQRAKIDETQSKVRSIYRELNDLAQKYAYAEISIQQLIAETEHLKTLRAQTSAALYELRDKLYADFGTVIRERCPDGLP